MRKNQRTSALIFVICTSTKSYQSLTSFIHVITETMTECIYFEIRSNHQNNLIHINVIIKSTIYDHPRPKWVMLMLRWYAGITGALLTCVNAVALRQISMHGLILSLGSSHWLLILIHINECMNDCLNSQLGKNYYIDYILTLTGSSLLAGTSSLFKYGSRSPAKKSPTNLSKLSILWMENITQNINYVTYM